jgi:hypothetical protein
MVWSRGGRERLEDQTARRSRVNIAAWDSFSKCCRIYIGMTSNPASQKSECACGTSFDGFWVANPEVRVETAVRCRLERIVLKIVLVSAQW